MQNVCVRCTISMQLFRPFSSAKLLKEYISTPVCSTFLPTSACIDCIISLLFVCAMHYHRCATTGAYCVLCVCRFIRHKQTDFVVLIYVYTCFHTLSNLFVYLKVFFSFGTGNGDAITIKLHWAFSWEHRKISCDVRHAVYRAIHALSKWCKAPV